MAFAADDIVRSMDHFPFLRLPAETRNMIYSRALISPGRAPLWLLHHDKLFVEYTEEGQELAWGHRTLALLTVCKQVKEEAELIFYYQNSFYFSDQFSLLVFLHGIGPNRRRYLRNIVLYFSTISCHQLWPTEIWYRALLLLAQSEHLEELEIRMDLTPYREQFNELERVRPWLLTCIPGLWVLEKFRGLKKLSLKLNYGTAQLQREFEDWLERETTKAKAEQGHQKLLAFEMRRKLEERHKSSNGKWLDEALNKMPSWMTVRAEDLKSAIAGTSRLFQE